MLSIKLYQSSKVRSDKYVATLPISLNELIELKRIEVEESFVTPDSNQATTQKIDMELLYAAPGGDEGEEAMQRALLQKIASRPDDAKSYHGTTAEGDDYDSVSVYSSATTFEGEKKKK